MGLFGKYKKAQQHVYSEDSDVNTDREDSRFIQHEGDFVLSVEKIKHGVSKNKKSKGYKKPYVVIEGKVQKIDWQSEHKPQTDNEIEEGKESVPVKQVREGESIAIHNKLPRETDPEMMTIPEQYQVDDVCALFGAILGVEKQAVDLAQVDDLVGNDGELLQGEHFGVVYSRSLKEHTDSEGNKTGEQSVYVNERPYPVDDDTLERTDPMTAEEVEELMSESAA